MVAAVVGVVGTTCGVVGGEVVVVVDAVVVAATVVAVAVVVAAVVVGTVVATVVAGGHSCRVSPPRVAHHKRSRRERDRNHDRSTAADPASANPEHERDAGCEREEGNHDERRVASGHGQDTVHPRSLPDSQPYRCRFVQRSGSVQFSVPKDDQRDRQLAPTAVGRASPLTRHPTDRLSARRPGPSCQHGYFGCTHEPTHLTLWGNVVGPSRLGDGPSDPSKGPRIYRWCYEAGEAGGGSGRYRSPVSPDLASKVSAAPPNLRRARLWAITVLTVPLPVVGETPTGVVRVTARDLTPVSSLERRGLRFDQCDRLSCCYGRRVGATSILSACSTCSSSRRRRFVAVLDGFGPDDWGVPTRCAAWSAQDVVRHLCDANAIIAGTVAHNLDVAAGFDPRTTPREWLSATS